MNISKPLPHSPALAPVWWNIHQTTHLFWYSDWTMEISHNKTYSGHNKVKPLIWNTGNFTSSLSTIPASLLHLHCSETSESSSRLFLVLHIWLHHLFNRENRNLRKDLLCLPAQSPNILWLLILPFIFDSCVIGRGSLLLSRKNIRALVLSPSKPNFVNYLISLSIFSVNSFSPCFFQWGPRWPQASSLKII